METDVQQYDPYKYDSPAKWPVFGYKDPFLVTVPDGVGNLMQSHTLRIPLALSRTLDLHSRAMGTSKSKWIRNAIINVLSAEQQWFDQHNK